MYTNLYVCLIYICENKHRWLKFYKKCVYWLLNEQKTVSLFCSNLFYYFYVPRWQQCRCKPTQSFVPKLDASMLYGEHRVGINEKSMWQVPAFSRSSRRWTHKFSLNRPACPPAVNEIVETSAGPDESQFHSKGNFSHTKLFYLWSPQVFLIHILYTTLLF